MLVATRDHEPRANERHFPHGEPSRSGLSRFTGAVQLLGSLVGIPIGLVSAYSIYHSNFSAEATCQSLRASIITMLDRKADASTLRMLVNRDIVAFERDCGGVDADAVAAFKNLVAAERAPPAARAKTETRIEPKSEAKEVKREAVAAEPPKAKAEAEAKTEAAVKSEPKKAQAGAPVPKRENPVEQAEIPEQSRSVEPTNLPELTKPAVTQSARVDGDAADARWIASVREALRDSASHPQVTGPALELALPPSSPVVVPARPPTAVAHDVPPAPSVRSATSLPPVEIPPAAPKPDHPVPPAPIPNVDAATQGAGD